MDISKSVQEVIDSSIRDWLQSHWPLGWVVTNLWLSLLLVLVLIVLFWGLLGALGRGVQEGWIWLLRSPLKLLGLMQIKLTLSKMRLPSREQRIETVIQQLTKIQQQQVQLLTELATLVAQRKT